MNNRIRTPFDQDYERALQLRFPEIQWREPVKVTVVGLSPRLVCRICIARYGLKAEEVAHWPLTLDLFNHHMEQHHPHHETPPHSR
jgi:hypothetical protein